MIRLSTKLKQNSFEMLLFPFSSNAEKWVFFQQTSQGEKLSLNGIKLKKYRKREREKQISVCLMMP